MTHYSTKKDDSDALELREAIWKKLEWYFGGERQNMRIASKDLLELFTAHTERAVEENEKKHIAIYRWLLGYEDFPESIPGKRYGWRTELRNKLSPEILEILRSKK